MRVKAFLVMMLLLAGLMKMPAGWATGAVFAFPVSNTRITSPFGSRVHPITQESDFHSGLDLAARLNQQVHAVTSGTVIQAGERGLLGNAVEIGNSASGVSTIYGHLNSVAVVVGQQLAAGQTLGYAGSTGRSTGVHVHFTVKRNGVIVDPMPFLAGIASNGTLIANDTASGAAPKPLTAAQRAEMARKQAVQTREAIRLAKIELAEARDAVTVAQKDADEYSYLFNEGAVSRTAADLKQAALKSAQDRVAAAQKKVGPDV